MKITKYIHSCLVVEEQEKKILIDPGVYTFEENALDINALDRLDFLLITHEHMDHMVIHVIKELLHKFPKLQIITNSSVSKILEREDMKAQTHGNEFIELVEIPHEKIINMPIPKNTCFTLFNKLTVPGDSLHIPKSAKILALPIQAPWGSMVQAAEKGATLKPQYIIPIHDWHLRDEARKMFYAMLENYYRNYEIVFKGLETGEVIEV